MGCASFNSSLNSDPFDPGGLITEPLSRIVGETTEGDIFDVLPDEYLALLDNTTEPPNPIDGGPTEDCGVTQPCIDDEITVDGGATRPPVDHEITEGSGLTQPPIDGAIEDGGPMEPPVDNRPMTHIDEITEDGGPNKTPVDNGPTQAHISDEITEEDGGRTQPPHHRSNEGQTSGAPPQKEKSKFTQRKKIKNTTGASQSELANLTPKQRKENARESKQKYSKKIEKKRGSLEELVPGCSQDLSKEERIDETIKYVQLLLQQAKEADEQNNHLKEKHKQLYDENTKLKEQIGILKMELDREKEHFKQEKGLLDEELKHWKENYEHLYEDNIRRLKQQMGLLDKQPQHQSVSLLQPTGETVRVNAANSIPEGPQVSVEISGVNDTEPAGDASLQVPEPQHSNEKEMESVLPSNEEEKADEAEFTSGGTEDEPADLNGTSGDPSAVDLSSKKRKQSVEETEEENTNLKEQLKHQRVSPQEETVPANAASLMPEDPQVILETSGVKSVSGLESQWNATEASRDASLQLQKAPHYHERETESVLKKRKQREEEAEFDQATSRGPAERVPDKASMEETVPVNTASSMPEGPQDIAEIRGLNATEATRDASLQVQKPTPNIVKEIEAVLPSNEEAKHGPCGYGNELDEAAYGSGGNEHEPSDLNGIHDDPSAIVLSSKRRKQSIEGAEVERTATIRSPAERFPSMPLSVSHPTSNGDAAAADTDILTKLNADDGSTVELSDFSYLERERSKLGEYSVPPSLLQTAKNIVYLYNDVYATCKMNPRTIEPINIVFVGSVNEMNDLTFGLVLNEKRILKLRDAINDALRINFEVDPAMEYLKKIARAHMALKKLENEPLRRLKGKDVSSAAAGTDILTKLDTSYVSTVELSDFSGLYGEYINIGKYSVPSSLESTAKKISGVCPDFSATCKMNPHTVNPIYIMLCAAVKEMNDQPIKQVTEERILKWRDAIKDAVRVGFKVDFAKEYLEKIGRALIALKEVENDPLRRFKDKD